MAPALAGRKVQPQPKRRQTDIACGTLLDSFADLADADGVPFQRVVLRVEKTGAEIGRTAAVDDCSAHDVRPLIEREAFGNAVIDNGLPVAVNPDDLLAVDPPDGRRV